MRRESTGSAIPVWTLRKLVQFLGRTLAGVYINRLLPLLPFSLSTTCASRRITFPALALYSLAARCLLFYLLFSQVLLSSLSHYHGQVRPHCPFELDCCHRERCAHPPQEADSTNHSELIGGVGASMRMYLPRCAETIHYIVYLGRSCQ